ncbi:hypothetical protein BC937DRAFT_91505 [Endogone sp. FLAS-F59071]|nr:hypothetical protein BC937DRAFT_91505 [Endogone sp. FLAS-F59071]|eukprot:RUS16203.1 hypothetical protein BC937DRAFT_91505 [Endogone sp. FLAS-F59071]
MPSCTSRMSHSTLSSELDVILSKVPTGSFIQQLASALYVSLKVSFFFASLNKLLTEGYMLRPAISVDCVQVVLRPTWMGKKSTAVRGSLRGLIRCAFVIMLRVPNQTLRFLSSDFVVQVFYSSEPSGSIVPCAKFSFSYSFVQLQRKNNRVTELWRQHSQKLGRMAEKFKSVAMQNGAETYSIESKKVQEDTMSNPFLAPPEWEN